MNLVQPVGVIDGEPRVLILKRSDRVTNLGGNLGPLNLLVGIMDDEHAFCDQLTRPNTLFVIISILAAHDSPELASFNRINFQQYQSVQQNINVLYTELNTYLKVERNRHGQEQTRLISVNDDTLKWILFICSGTFYSNMRYFNDKFFQNQGGDYAEFYRKEWLQRVELQDYVMTQLINLL